MAEHKNLAFKHEFQSSNEASKEHYNSLV